MPARFKSSRMQLAVFCFVACVVLPSLSRAQAPVFEITQADSKITFYIKSSVALEGTFDKWDAPSNIYIS